MVFWKIFFLFFKLLFGRIIGELILFLKFFSLEVEGISYRLE